MRTSGPFVVMGVSGCGKSTIGSALARRFDGVFLDADDFHPESNRMKMAAGTPLSDEDRRPWLDALNHELYSRIHSGGRPVVLACSALRHLYRDRISRGLPLLRFIYLRGSRELIGARLAKRSDHFMPAGLLDSQFATLEEPDDAVTVDIDQPTAQIVDSIISKLE